jgi:uncharacterized membrane protein YidH (DUF202 family)
MNFSVVTNSFKTFHFSNNSLKTTNNSRLEFQNEALGVFLIGISLITILGNFLVIAAVVRERSLKSSTNYYIVSLAVADLLVGLVVMPFNSLNEMTNNYWFFGDLWYIFVNSV